jgi:hypothetical protein
MWDNFGIMRMHLGNLIESWIVSKFSHLWNENSSKFWRLDTSIISVKHLGLLKECHTYAQIVTEQKRLTLNERSSILFGHSCMYLVTNKTVSEGNLLRNQKELEEPLFLCSNHCGILVFPAGTINRGLPTSRSSCHYSRIIQKFCLARNITQWNRNY